MLLKISLSENTKKQVFKQKGIEKHKFSKISAKYPNKNILRESIFKLEEPTEQPIDDLPNKIFVCEGDSCNKCESDESIGIDIQLTKYSLLDGTLSSSDFTDVEIIICGSTRQNHPSVKIDNLYEKSIKLQGYGENQYITFIERPSAEVDYEDMLELISDNVTIIINETKDSEDLIFYYAELKNSPIEVSNLVFLSGYSDLISISSVRNKLYAVSLQIFDAKVPKIKVGINFITFYSSEKNSNSLTLNEYDIPMDIILSLDQDKIDFIADTSIQKTGTENNIVADFEIGQDKKATVSFDSTWNSLKKVNFVKIKHNCDLEIISDQKRIALSIEVFGSGNVTRTGKTDDDHDGGDDGGDDASDSADGDDGTSNRNKERYILSTLTICCLVAVIIIVVGVAIYVISKKKCRKKGNQDFNDYLNNAEDLGDMNTPI